MKKRYIVFYIISILLLIVFSITLFIDYTQRDGLVTISFDFVVKVRCIEFLLPSMVCFIIGTIKRNKGKDNKNEF